MSQKLLGKISMSFKEKLFAIGLIVPAIAMLCLTILFPLAEVVRLSFYKYSLLNLDKITWNNFGNYKVLFANSEFINAFARTLWFVIGTVMFQVFFGLGIALLLNRRIRGRNFFRGLLFLPWTIPTLVVAVVWLWIYQPHYGILNYLCQTFQISAKNINWLGEMNTAMPSIIVAAVWKQMPLMMVMILAALQTIPRELEEAALIDGANFRQRLFTVTLPGISSVLKNLMLLSIIINFQMFILFNTMTGGGPVRATTTLAIYTYETAFVGFNMGKGAAIGVIWLAFLVIFALVYSQFARRTEEYVS
jgi:multiple sugar transport system permease protein